MVKKKIRILLLTILFIVIANLSNAILTSIIARIRCINYEEIKSNDDSFIYQGNEYTRCRDLDTWLPSDYKDLNIIGFEKPTLVESLLFHIPEYRMTSCPDNDIIYMRYWVWPVNARRNPPSVYVRADMIKNIYVAIKYVFSDDLEMDDGNNNLISITYGELFSKRYSGSKIINTKRNLLLDINNEICLYVSIYKGDDCLLFSAMYEGAYDYFELPHELYDLLNIN